MSRRKKKLRAIVSNLFLHDLFELLEEENSQDGRGNDVTREAFYNKSILFDRRKSFFFSF